MSQLTLQKPVYCIGFFVAYAIDSGQCTSKRHLMAETTRLTEERLSCFRVRSGHLVTSPSYFVDRFVPDCEILVLPEKDVAGGSLSFGFGRLAPLPERGLAGWIRRRKSFRYDRPVIDLRLHTPQNWAHFLNNHLPISFHVTKVLNLGLEEFALLLPKKTPNYILAAASLFGFQILTSDAQFEGENIVFKATPWTGIRPVRAQWVKDSRIQSALLSAFSTGTSLPRRVFLPRRDTRKLENQAEIEAFLGKLGFVTIYPESLPPIDQFRLFHEAEVIVAIHGASLAPLLYRHPNSRLRQVIELLPCGHMTDVYRVMADQVGVSWIGVRGRIKPQYVKPAYDFGEAFKAFSLDNFMLDITALSQAFALIDHPITKYGHD